MGLLEGKQEEGQEYSWYIIGNNSMHETGRAFRKHDNIQ